MASFSVHLGVATTASALASSATLSFGWVSLPEATALWLLGSFGGLLPDIDSDSSRPVHWVFNLLAVMAALWACWFLAPRVSLLWMWGGMAAAFLCLRPCLMTVFFQFTHHRGVFHSLLAGMFFGVLTLFLCRCVGHLPMVFSQLAGVFVGGGFVVHLLLDELYAVDFNGLSLKQSFGTAIKPLSLRNWQGSLVMIVLSGLMTWLTLSPGIGDGFGFVGVDWSFNDSLSLERLVAAFGVK